MSKVVVFEGSPRKNGYTANLLEQVINGAKSKGAEIVEYNLNDTRIRGCQGCFYCRTHDGCATDDYLQPMYKDINEADAIVLGSPIYYYQITGQVKVWLDRTFPMLGDKFVPRHPDKKAVTVFVQGNADAKIGEDGIRSINRTFDMYGWKIEDSIHYCGTSGNPDLQKDDKILARAFNAGRNLV